MLIAVIQLQYSVCVVTSNIALDLPSRRCFSQAACHPLYLHLKSINDAPRSSLFINLSSRSLYSYPSLKPRPSVLDFVSQDWRKNLQSCKTKSWAESLGSKLLIPPLPPLPIQHPLTLTELCTVVTLALDFRGSDCFLLKQTAPSSLVVIGEVCDTRFIHRHVPIT